MVRNRSNSVNVYYFNMGIDVDMFYGGSVKMEKIKKIKSVNKEYVPNTEFLVNYFSSFGLENILQYNSKIGVKKNERNISKSRK